MRLASLTLREPEGRKEIGRDKRIVAARDLSGGQRQMLALSQAFVATPRILL